MADPPTGAAAAAEEEEGELDQLEDALSGAANQRLYRYPPPYKRGITGASGESQVDWNRVFTDMHELAVDGIDPSKLRTEQKEEEQSKKGGAKGGSGAKGGAKGGKSGKGGKGGKGKAGKKGGQDVKSEIQEGVRVKQEHKLVERDFQKLFQMLGPTASPTSKDFVIDTPTGSLVRAVACAETFWSKKDRGAALDVWMDIGCTRSEYLAIVGGKEISEKHKETAHLLGSGPDAQRIYPFYIQRLYQQHPEKQDDHRRALKELEKFAMKLYNEDLWYSFQLQHMGDRLAPLNYNSYFAGRYTLDAWQTRCLQAIERRKNVLVCAPTSSGKTVLSTYLLSREGRILFVVPSSALALQVGAMFLKSLKSSVWVLCDQLDMLDRGTVPRVIVGTPESLETNIGLLEPQEIAALVVDEVHNLNHSAPMERLFHMLPKTQVLALSATVGNADHLAGWLKTLRPKSDVHVENVSDRFFNLQHYRYVEGDEELREISPCVGISLDSLQTGAALDVPFTPRDAYELWQIIEDLDEEIPDGIDPDVYFAPDEDEDEDDEEAAMTIGKLQKLARLSLKQVRQYGRVLLKFVASRGEETRVRVLDSFKMASDDKADKAAREALSQYTTNVDDKQGQASAEAAAAAAADADPKAAKQRLGYIYSLLKTIPKTKFPALCFNLDQLQCKYLYEQLLETLETLEDQTYPNRQDQLQKQHEQYAQARERYITIVGQIKNPGQRNEYKRQNPPPSKPPPLTDPHQDFVLGGLIRIGDDEIARVEKALQKVWGKRWGQYKKRNEEGLSLLYRGLRRGFALYTNRMPVAYLRHVQRLAQQGCLQVVFSDAGLSHGVNMPFRSTVFCGDHPELDTMMAQQMAGRAGRRGLDRAGSVIYALLTNERIKELMKGVLPDVVGTDIDTPAIFALPDVVPPEAMVSVFTKALQRYGTNEDEAACLARMEEARRILSEEIHPDHWPLVWLLRDFKECYALAGVVMPVLLRHKELHSFIPKAEVEYRKKHRFMLKDTSIKKSHNQDSTHEYNQMRLMGILAMFVRTRAASEEEGALVVDPIAEPPWDGVQNQVEDRLQERPLISQVLDRPERVDGDLQTAFRLGKLPDASRRRDFNMKEHMWEACAVLIELRNHYRKTTMEPLLRGVYMRMWYLLLESKF
eukprot:m.482426 g.482426  ORF g.482426 m.482426 type:complete len:1152 (-) comp22545_c0_seq1:67-3522(-)